MYFARKNARIIIQYATAYPFRLPESDVVCVYCCEKYANPDEFRQHMESTHPVVSDRNGISWVAFYHQYEGYVKADCTELKCRICNGNFDSLSAIASHLKVDHSRAIDMDHPLGLQPYMMRTDRIWCGICDRKFVHLRTMSKHIQTHYLHYTCDACGKSYATSTSLKHHVRYTCGRDATKPYCRTCRQFFNTSEEKMHHYKDSNQCRAYICSECGERFAYNREKSAHLAKVHNICKEHKCPECDMLFTSATQLSIHFKITHTDDFLACPSCDKRFANDYRLNKHLLVHSGEKAFKCSVCDKCFSRKSSLVQHMWIHSVVKRWTCKICDKPFNQKVCWKAHMKTQHDINCPAGKVDDE